MLQRAAVLVLAVVAALASSALAQATCGPSNTVCDVNAHCEYHYGSEFCACDSGYTGTGVTGDCVEEEPARYTDCGFDIQCCGSSLGSYRSLGFSDCENTCDNDDRCTHFNFDGAGCQLFSSCTGRKAGRGWVFSRNGDCPASRGGCKADLRITVTHAPVRRGELVRLRATVRRADNGQAVRNVRIVFTVRGASAGSATTNHQGVAEVPRYRYPRHFPRGRQSYRASHPGSSTYNAVHSEGTLTVS